MTGYSEESQQYRVVVLVLLIWGTAYGHSLFIGERDAIPYEMLYFTGTKCRLIRYAHFQAIFFFQRRRQGRIDKMVAKSSVFSLEDDQGLSFPRQLLCHLDVLEPEQAEKWSGEDAHQQADGRFHYAKDLLSHRVIVPMRFLRSSRTLAAISTPWPTQLHSVRSSRHPIQAEFAPVPPLGVGTFSGNALAFAAIVLSSRGTYHRYGGTERATKARLVAQGTPTVP